MDPITIAMGLGQFVPGIIKWMTGSDKAEAIATKAIDIAKTVTGQPSGDAALKALQADPNLVLQYRKAILDQELSFQQLAVQNAADVNKTMQAETAAEHWPTYGWRPAIGFAVALNVVLASGLCVYVFIEVCTGSADAAKAVAMLPATIGALAGINGTVLPVLGIASWFRGKMQADPNIPSDNRG